MGIDLNLGLGPTQDAYVFSDAVVVAIISNTGEGKTYASIAAMIQHAERCGRPILCAIVRDTHENIKTSTARSIMEFFEEYPTLYKFRNDFKQLTIYSDPRVDVDLFGIDDLASLSKLQGPQYALIWLEEPAPMADKVNAGLSEEVFNAALVRCARQKGTKPRLQVSMNPADQEHWTHKRLLEEPDVDPDNPLITKEVYFVPPGENSHVSEESRQAVRAAYKNDPASYMRYVLGQFAPVYKGEKVTPAYNPLIHLSQEPLIPAQGLIGFRAWDGWHNPACTLGQITTIGRVICLETIRLQGADIRTLINAKIKPLLNTPRWKDKCKGWRDIGDISMQIPDQSNITQNSAQVIEQELDTVFEAGPKLWDSISRGMAWALNHNIQGFPAVVVNCNNKLLHKALSGAWHYPTDNSGNITSKIPEKDEISHVGDTFGNGVCVLLPALDYRKELDQIKKAAFKSKLRAASYAGGG